MQILGIPELEQLVRQSFPAKRLFSAAAELGVTSSRLSVVTFVHGGPDPFLDRYFDACLEGDANYVALHQLLNRLCRQGHPAAGRVRSDAPPVADREAAKRRQFGLRA